MCDETPRTTPKPTPDPRCKRRSLARRGWRILTNLIVLAFYIPFSIFFFWACAFGWAIFSVGQERDVLMDALHDPAVQAPLVEHLARLALSDTLPGRGGNDDSALLSAEWLPPMLFEHVPYETLFNARITVNTSDVHMDVSRGGWDHGWWVEIAVSPLTPEKDRWGLFIPKTDDSTTAADAPLFIADLSKSAGYSQQELLTLGLAGNERYMEGSPEKAFWNQIALNLWAGEHKAARDACQRYYDRFPDEWAAVLLSSLLREDKSSGAGEAQLRDWVAREPGFPRNVWLAQFFELTGQPDALASALREAARYTEGDFRYMYSRTYHTATFALACGHPKATVAAADAILRQIDKPEYWSFQDDVARYNALKRVARQVDTGDLSPNEAISALRPMDTDAWGEGRHLDLPTQTPYTMLEQLLQRPIPRLSNDGVVNLP